MPALSTGPRRSSWFDTTAGMTIGSVPTRVRNSRSLRQWPSFDTSTSVRAGVAASVISQVMSYAAATAAKPRRTAARWWASSSRSKRIRMKKRTVSTSSNCALSTMLARTLTR